MTFPVVVSRFSPWRARRRSFLGLFALVSVASALLTAPAAPAATPRLRLSVKPSSITLRRGTATTVTLTVVRTAGFKAPVTLSGSSPRAGLRLSARQNPLVAASTTLTISAAATMSLGRTSLTVTARGGGSSASLRLSVNVTSTPAAGEIPIPVDPAPGSAGSSAAVVTPNVLALAPGQTANVLVTPVGAATGVAISYDVTGLPVGLLPEFFPNGATAQIRFTAATTLAPGTYPLVVRASQNGTVFSTAALAVNVTAVAVATSTTAVTNPTTSSSSSTSSTSPASTTTSSSSTLPAPVGDLIVTRRVAQTAPCDPVPPTATNVIGLTLTNTATTARVVSVLTRGTCTESAAALTLAAGGSAPIGVPVGSVLVVRSNTTPGAPIRRLIRVRTGTTIDVNGTATVNVVCTGPASTTQITLTDNQQVILSSLAVGSVCTLTEVDGVGPTTNSTDNQPPANDGIVTIRQRPPGCAVPTATTPNPSGTACYAELVFIN